MVFVVMGLTSGPVRPGTYILEGNWSLDISKFSRHWFDPRLPQPSGAEGQRESLFFHFMAKGGEPGNR